MLIVLGGPADAPTVESIIKLDPAEENYVTLYDEGTGLLYVTNVHNRMEAAGMHLVPEDCTRLRRRTSLYSIPINTMHT